MLWKMIWREIKSTFGRFASVFAIIAIGTGFFAGVRITTPVMLNTLDDYYRDTRFFDYRLLSTIGWTDKEVSGLKNESGVAGAEGSWQYDVILKRRDGKEAVYKVHSITEEVNQIQIKAGRMPESSRECVIDNNNRMGLSLGDKVYISDSNEQDTKDAFAADSYTVVGFAESSLYINFERGTTSIGNGTVQGFAYLPKDAFESDTYTEVYVKLDTDRVIYSRQYKDQMDGLRSEWETVTQDKADERYDRLYADAEEELVDARAEFEDEKNKGESELKDAREELDEGKQKLDDAAVEIADGRQKLADAAAELEDGKRELDDAAVRLSDARSELDSGYQILADTKLQLDDAAAALADGKEQLNDARGELAENKAILDAAGAELANGKAELDATEAALNEFAEMLSSGKAELDAANEQLQQRDAELTGAQQEIDSRRAEIEAAAAAGLIDEDAKAAALAELDIVQSQVDAGRELYESALADYQTALEEYEQNESIYNSSAAAYETGLEQYQTKQAEYEAGRAAYDEGKTALDNAQAEYDSKAALYNEGLAEYYSALAAYEQGVDDYYSGLNSYHAGLQEYENGLAEYDQAASDLEQAESDYRDGLKEYEDGEAEYLDAKETFDREIADAEKELQDAEDDLAAFEAPDTYLLERGTNIGYSCFESDSEIIKQIARVLPIFFILVAILVCMTTMTRMVEERRGQIGIMKGLGYSSSNIMFTFMAYSVTAAALGCIVGYAAGIFAFPTVIWFAYNMMYISIPLSYVFDWKLACAVFAVAVAATAGTTYLTCRNIMSESAASLMRPKAPKAGKRVLLERIPFIWKRMKFMHKVSARNIFRYKKRFFMMIVGISGCTALLLTGFGLKDSIATFVETQYDEIQPAQMGLVTDEADDISPDLLKTMNELDASYFMYNQSSWDLIQNSRTKNITLITPAEWDNIDEFFSLRTMRDEKIAVPEKGEALVSVSISTRYGVGVGDEITLRNEDMKVIRAKVTGVFKNYVYNYVVVSRDTLADSAGKFTVNGAYVTVPESKDVYEAQTSLAKCKGVVSVSVFADLENMISNMMSSLNYVILLIIASAAALAFVVLYNLTNINILERIREIATIKVLGFRRRETSEYVFRENIVLTTIGMVIGLVLGVFLHSFVIDQIVVDLVYFKKNITLLSFILSIILTFSFTLLVNLFMTAKLEKINMAESLKSVE
ncbi:MAG: FtsX-like permease family protein [Lachnospiraceae bacterium]|nr:FtsX-like permease family protein [Lachnospiraceae bacterium]